tara:strand:+ start:5636 stop:5956 length:321 start_codon:yes stop_codon:yes gene_type:complete
MDAYKWYELIGKINTQRRETFDTLSREVGDFHPKLEWRADREECIKAVQECIEGWDLRVGHNLLELFPSILPKRNRGKRMYITEMPMFDEAENDYVDEFVVIFDGK